MSYGADVGSSNIWILGGYQSNFARDADREALDFSGLTAEIVDSTLDAAGIGVVHVANAFGELFAHQGPWAPCRPR